METVIMILILIWVWAMIIGGLGWCILKLDDGKGKHQKKQEPYLIIFKIISFWFVGILINKLLKK